MRRRLVAALALALTALAVPVAGAGRVGAADLPECAPDERLVNPCRPWFGATAGLYPDVPADKLAQLLHFEERAGRTMDVAHTYHPVGEDRLGVADLHFARRPDTYLFTNWALTRDWASAAGGDAAVNARIDAMAASVKQLGDTRILLTLFHEPENDLSVLPAECGTLAPKGSSGTAADYRAMWANVRARFDAAGVTNVVWAVDFMNEPSWNCTIDALYPGDDLVDWVVFNGYQHGDRQVDFEARVRTMYSLLTTHSAPGRDYLSKPWGIVEWGINGSTQANAALFYGQARRAVEARVFPRLAMFLVFDMGNLETRDYSHRVGFAADGSPDPAEQAAFNAFAASWALRGSGLPPPGNSPPEAPPGLVATSTASRVVQLTWEVPNDDHGVSAYELLRDGVVLATTSAPAHLDASVAPARTYVYTVRAIDTDGATGPQSAPLTLTTPRADTVAPSRPGGVRAQLVGGSPVVSWQASTDAVGVTGYTVLRNGVRIATTAALSYADAAAPRGRTHRYTVRAFDAAGNTSAASAAASVTVPDTTAPTAVRSLTVARARTSAAVSWRPASDDVGVSGYLVFRGTTQVARVGAGTLRATVGSLTPGTRYTFRVMAVDGAGNRGPAASVTG